eukprot:scaffold213_cov245-Pinguiococcus_pyrenoidosus.AAC.13
MSVARNMNRVARARAAWLRATRGPGGTADGRHIRVAEEQISRVQRQRKGERAGGLRTGQPEQPRELPTVPVLRDLQVRKGHGGVIVVVDLHGSRPEVARVGQAHVDLPNAQPLAKPHCGAVLRVLRSRAQICDRPHLHRGLSRFAACVCG